jgi:hypothetical protein
MSVALALLIEIYNYALSATFDHRLSRRHFCLTFTLDAVKNVPAETGRVNAA